MKTIVLFLLMLCAGFGLFAEYAPQSILFSSFDVIEPITQYSDSLYTDCVWFNDLSSKHYINYLESLYEYQDNGIDVYCYYIKYKDEASVESMIALFESENKVTVAEPNCYFEPFNDPLINNQWALPTIKMDQVWNQYSYYGDNIVVGVVDSGIDLGLNDPNALFYGQIHPDLEDNLYTDANGYHGYNAYASEVADQYEYNVQDELGHGTHVAGIIGARKNNGYGISGIAGGNAGTNTAGCQIYSVKVGGTFNHRNYPVSAIIRGIVRAHRDGVRIFNCSFGFESSISGDNITQFVFIVNNLSNPQGSDPSLFICSTGNDYAEASNYPATLPYTMSVAATTPDDSKAMYSTYHSTVDIIAPGGSGGHGDSSGVLSTMPRDDLFYYASQGYDPGFEYVSGTSMAAPMVTAAVVLVKQAHPNLTLPEIQQRIIGTADDVSQANPDLKYIGKLGAGRLNVLKAIETISPHATLRLNSINANNNNYIVCGGQSMGLNIGLKNWWAAAQGSVSGILHTSDPNISISNNSALFTHIGQNGDDLYSTSFQISDSSMMPGYANFSLVLTYDNITETLYFKVPKRFDLVNTRIVIANRTAITEMVISDMNGDGQDEIAFITEENNNKYLCLLKSGVAHEVSLHGSCTVKPALADMDYDGIQEIVLFDGLGQLIIYDYDLNQLYDATISVPGEIKSYVIEDLNDDGRLDIAVAHQDAGAWKVSVLIFNDNGTYAFDLNTHSLDQGQSVISPLAVGAVDNTLNNDILWVQSNYVPGSGVNIVSSLVKMTYEDTRADKFKIYSGTLSEVVWGIDTISDYGCTELILSRPHPQESQFRRAYVYVGIGYTRTFGTPYIEGQIGQYTTKCINFCYGYSEVWVHTLSDNPSNTSQITQKAYNIIAGDFIESNHGVEILVGATEEILDSETGDFIQYIRNDYIFPFPPPMYNNIHFQPAVITDYNHNGIQDVFVYKGGDIHGFDANQNKIDLYSYTLPGSQVIKSLVAGNVRNLYAQDLYAMSTNNGASYVYYIPISSHHEEFYYNWRQFSNNARKTCEFLQPLPAYVNASTKIWNHCEIDQDVTIDSDVAIVCGTRVKFRRETGFTNYGVIDVQGTEDYPVTLSGVCPFNVDSYWDGISLHSNSLLNIGFTNISNAYAAIDIYNTGDNFISDSKFAYNKYSIKTYQALLDLESSILEHSAYGLAAFNCSELNLGYATGSNQINYNEIGIYSHESTPYLDEGNNDVNNPDTGAWNIYSANTPNGIKAQYNWWGNDDPTYIASKLNNPTEVTFEPFSYVSYFGRAKEQKTSSDFIMAEMLRCGGEWSQALPYYHSALQDSLSITEKWLSVNGLFKCHQKLNSMNIHKTWLLSELNENNDLDFTKYLQQNLAMANRTLGIYQDALDYYESILHNNPSYADSCYAVIDIGFTWLESDNRMHGKYLSLCPRSIHDHIATTNRLLNSIILDNPIHDNVVTPSIPQINSNYPNPFNPSTTIEYSIPQTGRVKLSIYNIRGQKVKTMINGDMEKGQHRIVWNGRDDGNRSVASGVYFIRIEAAGKTSIRKAMLLK